MILKLAISIALIGFLGISLLLLFGKSGAALQIANYFYFYLLGLGVWGLIKNEK